MSKLKSFIGLDFMTVKPYFTVKNQLLFVAVALFMAFVSGSIESVAVIGAMFGSIFMGYPFAVGEKSNMDALYATLSLGRKTVVAGRYLFTLTLNFCAVIITLAISSVGLFIGSVMFESSGYGNSASEVLMVFAVVIALFILMQSIMLPLYFKLGYAKTKFLTIIPFTALIAGYVTVINIARNSDVLSRMHGFISSINSGILAVFGVLGLCLVVCASYNLSLAFYTKREF